MPLSRRGPLGPEPRCCRRGAAGNTETAGTACEEAARRSRDRSGVWREEEEEEEAEEEEEGPAAGGQESLSHGLGEDRHRMLDFLDQIDPETDPP